MDDINLRADSAPPPPTAAALQAASTLLHRLVESEQAVARAERDLKRAKQQHQLLTETTIPEAMAVLQLTEFVHTSGLTLKVQPVLATSIPVENRPKAFAWLRANGHAGLIKTEVAVAFGAGEEPMAQQLAADLQARGLSPECTSAVNPQTLGAWGREVYEQGGTLPEDVFSVFRGRRAKVVPPKGSKKDIP